MSRLNKLITLAGASALLLVGGVAMAATDNIKTNDNHRDECKRPPVILRGLSEDKLKLQTENNNKWHRDCDRDDHKPTPSPSVSPSATPVVTPVPTPGQPIINVTVPQGVSAGNTVTTQATLPDTGGSGKLRP